MLYGEKGTMTDYKEYIETFHGIACEVSLRKKGETSDVVITAANKNYLASVGKAGEEFVPNRPYSYYIADTNMYKDKADFYTSHPGADRRRR